MLKWLRELDGNRTEINVEECKMKRRNVFRHLPMSRNTVHFTTSRGFSHIQNLVLLEGSTALGMDISWFTCTVLICPLCPEIILMRHGRSPALFSPQNVNTKTFV